MERDDDWHLTKKVHAGSGKGDPFAAAVRATRMAMIITDPRRHDNPIVFANDAFLRLTGYSRLDVTGRNCRFLQGPGTDGAAVARVREAVRAEQDIAVDLLNYRKDGSTFHNALYVSPVHDEAGKLLYFFASQLDVSDRYGFLRERDTANAALAAALAAKTVLVREIDHRVKNNLQMVSAMIRLQSRTLPDPALRRSLLSTVERIEALSTVHNRLHASEDVTRFDLGALVGELATDLVAATGRGDIALALDLAAIPVRADRSAALALLFNETITNALKHAFPEGRAGRLAIRLAREGDRVVASVEDDGVGLEATESEASGGGSFGSELIETLSRQLDAERTTNAVEPSGTRVTFGFPAHEIVAP